MNLYLYNETGIFSGDCISRGGCFVIRLLNRNAPDCEIRINNTLFHADKTGKITIPSERLTVGHNAVEATYGGGIRTCCVCEDIIFDGRKISCAEDCEGLCGSRGRSVLTESLAELEQMRARLCRAEEEIEKIRRQLGECSWI